MNVPARNDRLLRVVSGIVVALCVAACTYIFLNSLPTHFDDAYMFLRYADNLLAGRGHAWNPDGVQVFGSTSLLHLGVVTLLRLWLPRLADATLLLVTSAIPGYLALVVLVLTCARCTQHRLLHGNYLLWGALLLPSLILQETFKCQLRTGMDTMLSMLSNALLICFTVRMTSQGNVRRLVPVVVMAYVTYLARPDNGIYATLFPFLCILLLAPAPRRKLVVIFSLSMLVVLLADGLAKWLIFGDFLPLAFYAKQHGVYQGYTGMHFWNPIVYLRTFFGAAMPFVCIILLFVRRHTVPMLIAFLLPVSMTFAYYFSVNQIMGFYARFYYPSLPFFVVGAALVLDDWFRARDAGRFFKHQEFLLRVLVLLLVVLGGQQMTYTLATVYEQAFLAAPDVPSSRAYTIAASEPLPQIDGWRGIEEMALLAKDAPGGTVLALTEHGRVGARAPQVTLVDLTGLHDRQFARHGFSAAELFRRKPDVIWFPHRHYARMIHDILGSDVFWDRYRYYPGAFDHGLAIRKDSVHFERLSELFRQRWQALYGKRDPKTYLARPVE